MLQKFIFNQNQQFLKSRKKIGVAVPANSLRTKNILALLANEISNGRESLSSEIYTDSSF